MYSMLQAKVADVIGFESDNIDVQAYTSFAQFSASDAEKAKMIDGDTSTYMSLQSGIQKTQTVRISWDAGEEFFIHEMFY